MQLLIVSSLLIQVMIGLQTVEGTAGYSYNQIARYAAPNYYRVSRSDNGAEFLYNRVAKSGVKYTRVAKSVPTSEGIAPVYFRVARADQEVDPTYLRVAKSGEKPPMYTRVIKSGVDPLYTRVSRSEVDPEYARMTDSKPGSIYTRVSRFYG